MMHAVEQEVWTGNNMHSPLSASVRLMDMKCRYQFPEGLYNEFSQFMQEMIPKPNLMPHDYYNAKKLVRGLGLPVDVIHCCNNNCMLFWKEDNDLDRCKFCGHMRYKAIRRGSAKRKVDVPYKKMHYFPITPRLQRLYASNATAGHMRWHAEHMQEDGKMCHPSDSPAWKHLDSTFPEFANEVRNVRIGLCSDGFQPSG